MTRLPSANPDLHHGLGRDTYLSRQRQRLEAHYCIITRLSDNTHPRLHAFRGCQLIAVITPRRWLVKSQTLSPTAVRSSQPTRGKTSTPRDGAEKIDEMSWRDHVQLLCPSAVRNDIPLHPTRPFIHSLHPSKSPVMINRITYLSPLPLYLSHTANPLNGTVEFLM